MVDCDGKLNTQCRSTRDYAMMSSYSKVLAGIGMIGGVVIVGLGLGWLGSGGWRVPNAQPPAMPGPTPIETVEIKHSPPLTSHSAGLRTESISKPNPGPTETSETATNLIKDWSDKVDDILASEGKEAEKAKQLLEMFPRLPEEGQAEVAQHLANLLPDQDYPPLRKYLVDAAVPEPVLDVLIADALNRPNSLKLPALLEIARQPQHPKAGEARDLLELFLEEDYGNDWSRWEAKMNQWLKENPD